MNTSARDSGLRNRRSIGGANPNNLGSKLGRMPWMVVFALTAMALFGTMVLYASTINDPVEGGLPVRHIMRFFPVLVGMLIAALVPLGVWSRLAFPLYFIALILLIGVEVAGQAGGGAVRWLDIGPVRIQPSEIMKVAVTLALARYYQWVLRKEQRETSGIALKSHKPPLLRRLFVKPITDLAVHVPAIVIMGVPAALVMIQPDLGTALMVLATGFAIMVFAGLNLTLIGVAIAAQVVAVFTVPVLLTEEQRANPASNLGFGSIAYFFILKEYQQKRVDSLLDPSSDPLGTGYQAEQARIAVGSGGFDGKGYLGGTQSQLDYIPEQHTDFIFTALAEEFGFLGSVLFLTFWAVLLGYGLYVAARATSLFGKFAAGGAVVTVAFYVAFNIGMVLGLLPVVGVPLPLVS